MASTKELLAQKLKQNTEKHQQAQKDNIRELKEFRRNVPIEDISRSPNQPRKLFEESQLKELADSIDEVGKPEMWLKANPNLGKTVTYETYQLDVERAEKSPSARNDILAKRFNLPMEGYTYFFSYEETLCHRHRDYWQMPCAMGADLSRGDDFCAFTFLFPLSNGYFGVKTRDYITSYTLSQLPVSRRQQYEEFMQEGTLFVFDGTILDMMQVYDDLDAFIERNRNSYRHTGQSDDEDAYWATEATAVLDRLERGEEQVITLEQWEARHGLGG